MHLVTILARTAAALRSLLPVTVLLQAAACIGFSADTAPRVPLAPEPGGAVTVLDGYLAERIESLERRSALFRGGMRTLREGDTPVLVGTPAQVAAALGTPSKSARSLHHAGEFQIASSGSRQVFVVRVDVAALRSAFRTDVLRPIPLIRPRPPLQARFDALIEAVLIHEIWGHLVPVAQAGDPAGRCADPRPGEPAGDSCVMKREALIRQELGLTPRRTYALRW